MRSFIRYTLLAFAVMIPVVAVADPYGPPFQVNTSASGNLMAPSIAAASNGDVIVLWQSGPQNAGTGFIRRFTASGQQFFGQDVSVGSGALRVAAGPAGSYAVLSMLPAGSGTSLFVTVYNRSGGVIVPQLRVSDPANMSALNCSAAITMNASGQFVVAWSSRLTDRPYFVYARRFNANGSSAGPQVLVHSNTTSSEWVGSVDVALDAVGNFVVNWDFGDEFALDFYNVYARRFNAGNLPLGPAIRVNTTTPGDQDSSRIAMNDAGSYVIVWHGPPPGGTGDVVFGQRFSPAGAPLGGEFQLTTATSSIIEGVDVAMAPDGSFVATWQDDTFTVIGQIVARAYNSAGIPLGNPFQVSSASNDFPVIPWIAMDRAGNYMIMWWQTHFNQTDFNKLLARRYSTSGVVIQPIANNQTRSPLSGAAGSWQYFKLTVPAGQPTVDITISGGLGDADLYTRWGALPTLTDWDGRPFLDGNNEGARMLNFPPGDWYIGINGFVDYSALSLQVSSH